MGTTYTPSGVRRAYSATPVTTAMNSGGGTRARGGVVAELGPHPLEAPHPLGHLRLARLDLERRPPPVGELDDRVRLEAGVIAVVAHGDVRGALEGVRVHHQVAHAEVLEHEPEGLPVSEQRVWGHPEDGHRQGGVREVAPGLEPHALGRAGRREPAGDLLEQVHGPEQVQVVREGLLRHPSLGGGVGHVVGQRAVGRGLAEVAR